VKKFDEADNLKELAPFGLWDEGEMNDLKCTSNGHLH
jgi:hypothetical protein